jgi:predicted lipase
VHAGFELGYIRVREPVLNATWNLAQKYPDYQIIFIGHSLGGAIATLSAVDFHDRFGYGDRISLYTFGQPRVGDLHWARYVNKLPFASRMYRVSRRGDPLPHIPPLIIGYEHSLQMYSFLDSGEYIKCDVQNGTGESPKCLNDWLYLSGSKHSDYFKDNYDC